MNEVGSVLIWCLTLDGQQKNMSGMRRKESKPKVVWLNEVNVALAKRVPWFLTCTSSFSGARWRLPQCSGSSFKKRDEESFDQCQAPGLAVKAPFWEAGDANSTPF